MPTLINYNQSTFKNNVKPNKRRLQELQHSAARAHAARVAYWRKKGIPPAEPKSPHRRGIHGDDDSNASSKSTAPVKHESDNKLEASSQRSSRASEEIIPAGWTVSVTDSSYQSEHHTTTSNMSGSLVTTSHPTSVSTKDKWRLGSETTSSYDGQRAGPREDLAEFHNLTRHPTSHLFDPFDSVPIRQDGEVVAAMDHYIHNWAPSQRPGLKYQTKDNPLIRDAFPAALQNVELFEATVALCLSFKAAGQNFQTRMCNWSLYHKGQALSGIRTKLTSGWVDEAVILATVFLMIIDNVFLDVHAYETHLDGLRKMAKAFKAASSKELFGGSLLSFIAWAESNALLILGNRVALHNKATDNFGLRYPSQPFPSTLTIMIGTLTPGFQSVALDGHISLEVLSILAKTVRWTRCIDPESGQSPSETDQPFLMNFDPRANSAELMRLCRVSSEEHRVERAICKALYVYHANILGWTCRCSGYRRVVEELGDTLRSWVFQETWDMDLWKWLAPLTANAARRGKLQYLQMEVMARFMGLEESAQTWEAAQGATKKFLLHSKLDREWKLCWEMAKASVTG